MSDRTITRESDERALTVEGEREREKESKSIQSIPVSK